ncbi:MAG: hypothetical protein K1X28_06435 [Parachlamydiales bacterium]|nr:hypothetical protein [Parachlamydiales bacterium]
MDNIQTYGEYEDAQGHIHQFGEKEKFVCRDAFNHLISHKIIRDAFRLSEGNFKMEVLPSEERIKFPSGEDPNNLNYCYVKRVQRAVITIFLNPI